MNQLNIIIGNNIKKCLKERKIDIDNFARDFNLRKTELECMLDGCIEIETSKLFEFADYLEVGIGKFFEIPENFFSIDKLQTEKKKETWFSKIFHKLS